MSVNVSLSPWCWTVSRAAAVSQTTSEKDDSRNTEIDISCSFFSSIQVMWPLESNSVLVGWDTPLFIGFWFLPITDATFVDWQLSGRGSSRLSSHYTNKVLLIKTWGAIINKQSCVSVNKKTFVAFWVIWKLLREKCWLNNKYSYRIWRASKSITKMCVLIIQSSETTQHWSGVSGSHDLL